MNVRMLILLIACAAVVFIPGCSQPPIPEEIDGAAKSVARLLPPPGKILLFMGQDLEANRDYAETIPEPVPAGVTTYTQLVDDPDAECPVLGGLTRGQGDDRVCVWGTSHQSSSVLLREYPNTALAIGLQLADSDKQGCSTKWLDKINSGEHDAYIGELGTYLKEVGVPIYLRIGYEFDGPWNCYEPEPYVNAFRRIVRMLWDMGVTNVATVWQSAGWPYDSTDWEAWYPGDEYVDWVGLSYFLADSAYNTDSPPSPETQRESLLEFARAHSKPVMIAEASNQGYDNQELTRSFIFLNNSSPVSADQIWESWYVPFFDFIYTNADVVRAVAYINSDWAANPHWECVEGVPGGQPECPNGMWGDSRVTVNELIRDRWVAEIKRSVWLHSSPNLFSMLEPGE